MGHLEYIRALREELDKLDGRTVHAGPGASKRPNETAEAIAAALRRRKIVRER